MTFGCRKTAIDAGYREVERIRKRKDGRKPVPDSSASTTSTGSHLTLDDTPPDNIHTPPVPRNVGPPVHSNRIRAEKTLTAIKKAQEMLEKREQEMTNEIPQLKREAKNLLCEQNLRSKALRCIKKKKRLEIQSKQISNHINSLECQKEAISNALYTCDALNTIQRGIDEARLHHGNEAVTELDRLLDKVQAELDAASSSINGVTSTDDSGRGSRSDLFEEEELLREIYGPIIVEVLPEAVNPDEDSF